MMTKNIESVGLAVHQHRRKSELLVNQIRLQLAVPTLAIPKSLQLLGQEIIRFSISISQVPRTYAKILAILMELSLG